LLREAIEQSREENHAHGQWQFPIAGFMLSQLGHLPRGRRPVAYEGWRFEVVDLDGRCIDKILATPPEKSP
jgi:CBS domain containing-hemolysin-like protein